MCLSTTWQGMCRLRASTKNNICGLKFEYVDWGGPRWTKLFYLSPSPRRCLLVAAAWRLEVAICLARRRSASSTRNDGILPVFAKFQEDKLIDINQKEKLMSGLANKVDKTHSGHPFGYNWARWTLVSSGLRAKPPCSWSPYVLWDVDIGCVWKKNAILPRTAVIYKNFGKFKYDASSEKNLICVEFDSSVGFGSRLQNVSEGTPSWFGGVWEWQFLILVENKSLFNIQYVFSVHIHSVPLFYSS
jgi:hypothetical protein